MTERDIASPRVAVARAMARDLPAWADSLVPFDTGRMHGPAIPRGSQLLNHPGFGFGAYVGPWLNQRGERVPFGPYFPGGAF